MRDLHVQQGEVSFFPGCVRSSESYIKVQRMVPALESLEEEITDEGLFKLNLFRLVLSHSTIYFSAFQVMKFGNLVELCF